MSSSSRGRCLGIAMLGMCLGRRGIWRRARTFGGSVQLVDQKGHVPRVCHVVGLGAEQAGDTILLKLGLVVQGGHVVAS